MLIRMWKTVLTYCWWEDELISLLEKKFLIYEVKCKTLDLANPVSDISPKELKVHQDMCENTYCENVNTYTHK